MKKYTTLVSDGAFMNYVVYTPDEMKKGLPMIVYLHGAGERGDAVDHLSRRAVPYMLDNGLSLEAVVLCPQCPGHCVWDNIPFEVKKLIDETAAKYEVDMTRLSITGSSMGGFGTWTMGLNFPNFFSAMAPVAGGGMAWRAPNLITTPIRAYHGEKDEAVPVICSEMMVNAVNRAKGSATLTVLPNWDHNGGIDAAYRDTDVLAWLLAQKRTDFTPVPEMFSKYF